MKCWYCGSSITGNKNKMFCNEHCRYKYNHQADMVLILKKQWFDMIISGEKAEEYREIKPYWEKRFLNYFGQRLDLDTKKWVWNDTKKVIVFRNGYGKNVPEFSAECSIREDYGYAPWGAEKGKKYYVLTIHRVFGVKE